MGVSYSYSSGGSYSNFGDGVQYLFDWGDGTNSGWLPVGTTSASKAWMTGGVYSVKVQTRCINHTTVVSLWSQTLSVTIVAFSISSPNGGETLTAGSTQTIRWTYAGNPGSYVKIELLKDGVVNRTIKSSISIGTGGSGSCNWLIPSTQVMGSDYQIRITSNGSYTDISDDNFTIVGPPPPTITVLSPNDGETWTAGSMQKIRWAYDGNPGSFVKIELVKGGVVNRIIKSLVLKGSGGSGSFNWTIPANQTSGIDYRIRVTSTSNGIYAGTNTGDFAITAPTITVVSPNGGETLTPGSTQTIQWTYTGNPGSYLKIELLKGGILNRTIAWFASKGTGGNGSYNWRIPLNQAPGSDYQIRVTSTSNYSFLDISDRNFTISK